MRSHKSHGGGRRREPISSAVTRYRIEADGTRRRIDTGKTQPEPTLTFRTLMNEAAQRGLGQSELSAPSASWDQDN